MHTLVDFFKLTISWENMGDIVFQVTKEFTHYPSPDEILECFNKENELVTKKSYLLMFVTAEVTKTIHIKPIKNPLTIDGSY